MSKNNDLNNLNVSSEDLEKNEISKNLLKDDEKSIYKVNSRRDVRTLAFYLLYAADRFDYSIPLEQIIKDFKIGFNLEVPEDSFAIQMVKGTAEERKELDEQIKPFLKNWKLERLGCCTRLILQLALWELKNKKTASSIVINEAIELAKAFAEKDAYKFVNGILDEICKKMNEDNRQSNDNGEKNIASDERKN